MTELEDPLIAQVRYLINTINRIEGTKTLVRKCGDCHQLGLDQEGTWTDGYKLPADWYCDHCCRHCDKCHSIYVGGYHDRFCK